ncbi:MAG: biotin/lipoyl-binding protein, partial [Burkholderiales bacterium]
MKRAAWFLALSLAASAAAAADLKTAPVEMREVDLDYSAEAVVEAVRQSTVSAQISGRIVDLRFDVGDVVKKGEVIARIDERAVSQAEAASVAQVREAQAA